MSAKDVSVKFLQEPFKMPEMHILCNHQPVNFVELRLMSHIGRLVAEDAPGRDDAEGRLMFFKIMRVNRCGVRTQERFTLRSFMQRRTNRLLKIKSILRSRLVLLCIKLRRVNLSCVRTPQRLTR